MLISNICEKEVRDNGSSYVKVYLDSELKFVCFGDEDEGFIWEVIKGGKDVK